MLIPTKMWEETRDLENQIFDAIPVERLAALMRQYVINSNRYRQLSPVSQSFNFVSPFDAVIQVYSF